MRLALRVVAVVLFLAAGAIAILLVPPHVQIRGIAPELPSEAQLRSLGAVGNGPVAVHYLSTATQASPDRTLGHTVFAIEWQDGRLFMIDASMDRKAADEFAELLKLMNGAEDGEYFGSVADLLGGEIQQVSGVGFTHLHIDHTQGVVPFCEARGQGARVYQTPDQRNEQNLHTKEGARIVRDSCLGEGTLKGDVILQAEEFPGLGIVALGGHTPGSTLFAVPVKGHLWLFAGDTTNSKINLIEDRGKGLLYSNFIVPEDTTRTAQLRSWLLGLDGKPDITVVVSHDIIDTQQSGMPAYGTSGPSQRD
ncbi:MAG: glyoxylase-like metal-dependent hydrolase (beta-lactamase superfamily II) [Myxococcota bacterium]|jgi:glyoxylase-like metal-dependent hydrolase (beta-lactamase superfamily II)